MPAAIAGNEARYAGLVPGMKRGTPGMKRGGLGRGMTTETRRHGEIHREGNHRCIRTDARPSYVKRHTSFVMARVSYATYDASRVPIRG